MSHSDVGDLLDILRRKEEVIQDNEFYYKALLEKFMWHVYVEGGASLYALKSNDFSINEIMIIEALWKSALSCPIVCPEGARCTRQRTHDGPCAHSCGVSK